MRPDAIVRYRSRRWEDVDLLCRALRCKDFRAIQKVGHRIRGNAALFGLDRLGQVAEDLENAAVHGDRSKVADCITRFRDEVERIPC